MTTVNDDNDDKLDDNYDSDGHDDGLDDNEGDDEDKARTCQIWLNPPAPPHIPSAGSSCHLCQYLQFDAVQDCGVFSMLQDSAE